MSTQTIPLSVLIECRDLMRKAAVGSRTFDPVFSVMAGTLGHYINKIAGDIKVTAEHQPADVQS